MANKKNLRKVAVKQAYGKEITVSMSTAMYNSFMKDKYDDKGHVIEHGFKNVDELMNYINTTWGLLGVVTEIVLDDE